MLVKGLAEVDRIGLFYVRSSVVGRVEFEDTGEDM